MSNMRKTKIVCTLGPASNNKVTFSNLVKAGLNVARFNFSHGSHESHKETMDMVKQVREELNEPIAILLDTKGPEIRLKEIEEGTFLNSGDSFILTSKDLIGNKNIASITYDKLYQDVKIGDNILIDDGLVRLRVEKIEDGDIYTTVVHGGEIKTKKGVNAPDIRVNLPAITQKDIDDILFGIEQKVDFIAASFIRKAEDVLAIRQILEEHNADIQIISKIENREGYDNLDEILSVSDGIMVARGDLGVEIPISEVPIAQKEMIRKCNRVGKPVITATQMLDSMIRNPSPTRAEATDVANAIFDGSDAIMLSGETAAGKYPVEAVVTMDTIARRTERALDYRKLFNIEHDYDKFDKVTVAVSRAVVETANDLGAKAILTATSSGFTAARVAMHRPEAIIVAATYTDEVRRKMSIIRGVYTAKLGKAVSTDEIVARLEEAAREAKYVDDGDLVVVSAGIPVGVAGATNLMRILMLGSVMKKGTGIGRGEATGRLHVLKVRGELPKDMKKGDILYAQAFNESHAELIQQAGALICAEGGYTSFGAVAGVELNIPTVVGVENVGDALKDGMQVTVNADMGLVHNRIKQLEE